MTKKHYANRDVILMGQTYVDHVMAMTTEGLYEKSDIAAELAFRDILIQTLAQDRDQQRAMKDLARKQRDDLVARLRGFSEGYDPLVIGSRWRHHNGEEYVVRGYANMDSTKEEYPPTVIYVGVNGKQWSRPLTEWSRSFRRAGLTTDALAGNYS